MMSAWLQRAFFLLGIVLLQRSFFDILWPHLVAPALVIAIVVAIVFVLGFAGGLVWVIMTVCWYALLGETGILPMMAIGIAYGTGFLSRRLLIEHQLQSVFILAVVAAGGSSAYQILLAIQANIFPDLLILFGNALLAFLVFPLVFVAFRHREDRIRTSLMSEFRGLKTT